MYHFHHTDGIIIASRVHGETDRRYRVFTREYGLIAAQARGVRSMASKLRYALQPYSLARLVLVRGKSGWRITNAVPIRSFASGVSGHPDARSAMVKAAALIARMMPEDETHADLFELARDAFGHIADAASFERADTASRFVMLKTLSVLGYVSASGGIGTLLASSAVPDALTASDVRAIDAAIQSGLAASHL